MNPSHYRFLPPNVAPADIRATLGLVSDTHMGQRMSRLAPELFDVLAGVDLILHAGDVGVLDVLSDLGAIAPVIAVQGNDESGDGMEHLPLQQVIGIQGERVLLWHSHYVDPELERASRVDERLPLKLERTIARARACGASLAVFGHWHIPLTWDAGDVLVVNPGALASPNELTRQHVRSVAIAWLLADGKWQVSHVSIENPTMPWLPEIDWDSPFSVTGARFSTSVFDAETRALMPLARAALPAAMLETLREAIRSAALRVWEGDAPPLTWRDIERAALAAGLFTDEELALLTSFVAQIARDEDGTEVIDIESLHVKDTTG